MAKLFVLALSLCFVLFSGCFAFRQQPEKKQCQIKRLNPLKPDKRTEAEAGIIETWNPNNEQLECAGVALVRTILYAKALHRTFYTDAPQQIYIQQGKGYFGVIFSGCPETYEEPQEKGQHPQERHQKVYPFREGDLITVPTGVPFWMYNPEQTPVVAITLIDVNNLQNQLGGVPKRFYLSGNQEQEFLRYEEQEGEKEGGNIFKGFSKEFLEDSLCVSEKIAESLQANEDKKRGPIVRVGDLRIITPPMRKQQQQQEEEEEEEDQPHSKGSGNGIDETVCTMRLRQNIGQSLQLDFYNPQAGKIKTAYSKNFRALRLLGLSAQYGSLKKNAMFVPHYTLNAHTAIYALEGKAKLEVVNCNGETVFDGELEEGQVLIVPQNFAVAAKSRSANFEYVAFKTNDKPMIATLAGSNSLFNALPDGVITNTYKNLKGDDARQIKKNNPFKFLVPPPESERRSVA